ncbi:MAG: class I SAM-dependent methyltransferase, partial [Actinobacteria bacterium]|nr:class I SAM-dependent methyltransferase [Actinomycetota bacterium]
GEEYYRYRESTGDFKTEVKVLYRLLKPGTDSKILEIGCGGGALLALLESKGHIATGVDIYEDAVKLAIKNTMGCDVVRCDAIELPFEDSSFDRILSHHVLEHLHDLPKALLEWRRVLKPGGIIAVCTPNNLYPRPDIFDDPSHVKIYSRPELAGVFAEAGFELLSSSTIFPHLAKGRISVRIGVPLYKLFIYLPYFREHGRSILLSARKPPGQRDG